MDDQILDKILFYSKYINWLNLIYFLTFIIYFLFWLTRLTRWHWRSNSFTEYIFRILIVIPFWVVFVMNSFSMLGLYFENTDDEPYVIQNIKIVNQSELTKKYSIYLPLENTWIQQYEKGSFLIDPSISVMSSESKVFSFALDTSISKSFLIKEIGSADSLEMLNGKYFRITGVDKIIYSNNLSKGKVSKRITEKRGNEELMILLVIAIMGSWYYRFVVVKPREKKQAMIFGISISLVNIFIIIKLLYFYLAQDLFRIQF